MAKTKRRQAFAERFEFSDEEFEASGIRELSFEELLAVNGGRHVIDDPSTDDVSDTIANGGHSPGGSSSSSDSGSSGGSSGGSSSAPPSSSPSEPVIGSDSDDTGGSTCDGWNNYWNGLTSGGSSGGGSSGSTGDSSGNSDLSGDSSSNDSSGDDYSSGDDSDSGYWGSGYTPPEQSQPAPKPNKGEETSLKPEPKKGWGEKISDWFNGKRVDVGASIKGRFSRGLKGGAGEGRNTLQGKEKNGLPDAYDKADKLLKDKKKEEPLFSGKMIKQKELEQKYDYPNTLCYLTDIVNMYRVKDGLEDKGVDNFMRGAKDVYIKPDGEVPDFSKTSKALAKESNASMYYEYVYPKENGYQLLKLSEENFKAGDYEFGIAECYKTGDSRQKICHFTMVQNKPWQENDPGTGLNDYTISQIRPVQRLELGE